MTSQYYYKKTVTTSHTCMQFQKYLEIYLQNLSIYKVKCIKIAPTSVVTKYHSYINSLIIMRIANNFCSAMTHRFSGQVAFSSTFSGL